MCKLWQIYHHCSQGNGPNHIYDYCKVTCSLSLDTNSNKMDGHLLSNGGTQAPYNQGQGPKNTREYLKCPWMLHHGHVWMTLP